MVEYLKIKTVLDAASGAAMERTLSQRFMRVSKRFGRGLKDLIKGSVIGISIGLLDKILNPIAALEEKIKSLLGQSTDIRDLAEQFNTTPGQLKRLQDVAQSLGVQPDQLREMLSKYAQAVETAREELRTGQKLSESSKVVKDFVEEKDLAEGMVQLLRALSVSDNQALQEKAVFGEKLVGGARRLRDTDIGTQAASLNLPSAQRNERAIQKNAGLQDTLNELNAKAGAKNFLAGSDNLNAQMIAAMQRAEAKAEAKEMQDLKRYETLRATADEITRIGNGIKRASEWVAQGVGALGRLEGHLERFLSSRFARGLGLGGPSVPKGGGMSGFFGKGQKEE